MPAAAARPRRKTAAVPPKSAPKVGFVSLGCPKALVDSERILTQLRAEGYETVGNYDSADVVIVNTCGFIDSAVAESLDAIGDAMAENGKVIVTGCLGAQARRPSPTGHPNVLKVTGPHDVRGSRWTAVHLAELPPLHDPFLDLLPAQRRPGAGPDDIGIKPHAAPLRVLEDFRRLQSQAAASASSPRCAATSRARPIGEVMLEAQKLAS